ncbi:hypothetical protein N0V90_006952 [Kalmusia sp. IMI 367209]|nr:hypothetical protein N0V90_006952 [Kalmusia sp. IMI 367209]
MGKAKYILLDCDNTLCKSEALAFQGCAETINLVLEEQGIDKRYTAESLLEDFVGYNFREMLKKLQPQWGFTLSPEDVEKYVARELEAVVEKLDKAVVECPGVTTQLEWLKKEGYPMSVVSTSAKPRVIASLKKCNMLIQGEKGFFKDEHVYSAATSLPTGPSSKPDPAVYHYACEQLGVKESECITVEDSKSGATAAMRAGIPCIGYVGIYGIEDGPEKMEQMAKVLTEQTKCAAIMYDWGDFPDALKKLESKM